MHASSTGGPDSQIPGSTVGELPPEIQRDVDSVARVVAAGFQGGEWAQLAAELHVYAYKTLHRKMRRSSELMELVAHSETPLVLSDDERSALHSSFDDRADIATKSLREAMQTFPQALKRGTYNPAANPGKNGKYKALPSFFVGRCGLHFPRAFAEWRRERTDRFVERANEHKRGWILSDVVHQTAGEPDGHVPDDVTSFYFTLTAMIDDLRPRNRAVWRMTLEGCSRGEIAEQLEIKLGDVDNALYTFRSKVKALRREGKLIVPPVIEAEWARSKPVGTPSDGEGR
ncbi:hypothetical protein OG927_35815 (plasmid) [Streptomyces clavifer]|uniref:hypothetical protein n=1 Tax=Streptomyces clavifer TaxID=68188 RepID=UPI002E809116|nr:hypothetical protein [Streptomyces clavifer]WUC32696.1 hypothetical protein OG927_35815 [Streptomyces clavifer]